MLTMPKPLEYALMVLAEMHAGSPGELFSARALGDKLDIPFDVVSKALSCAQCKASTAATKLSKILENCS